MNVFEHWLTSSKPKPMVECTGDDSCPLCKMRMDRSSIQYNYAWRYFWIKQRVAWFPDGVRQVRVTITMRRLPREMQTHE